VLNALDLSRADCVWEGQVLGARQRVACSNTRQCESKVTVLSTSEVTAWGLKKNPEENIVDPSSQWSQT